MPLFFLGLLIALIHGVFTDDSVPQAYQSQESSYSQPLYQDTYSRPSFATHRISYDDALDEYWDEIKEYINGTETIEVYSYESGNYYTLDADISNGEVESIYFPSGGYIYINADLNSDGTGEGYGSDSYWDVEIDSYLIENAVEEWASDNGYEISY
ncbi:MAG: hypothetical protein RIQ41_418 [Candidatus Parcubacteria bacterium]|jgi:hypothetical protein